MNTRRLSVLLASTLVLGAHSAPAQELRVARVEADNDQFDLRLPTRERTDYEYTHGARLHLEFSGAPRPVERFASRHGICRAESTPPCLLSNLEVGQEIYNARKDSPTTLPGHRPYAGWLYLDAGVQAADERRLRSAAVQVGITGPASLGERVQTGFHRRYGWRTPQGWADQLRTEPGLIVSYEESRLLLSGHAAGARVAELVARGGGDLGNVHTGGEMGVRGRLGYGVPHPWLAQRRDGPVSAYASGAAGARLVLRNLFLDGNTFRDSPRVRKHPLVTTYEAGAGLRIGSTYAEFGLVHRGKEYRTQEEAHTYGTFRFGYQRLRAAR